MRDADRFLRFLEALPGGPDDLPGVSWRGLATWARSNPERFAEVVVGLVSAQDYKAPVDRIPLVEPPSGTQYEKWTENKRRAANLNALAGLRQFQASGRDRPTAQEQRAMEAYSGWGGFLRLDTLPPDPRLFPQVYVDGIEAWRRARVERTIPHGSGADLFEGLKHQYFTPVEVAQAMYDLACRASPFRVATVLEPSAGIGRFVRVGQGTQWTAVEYDALLAEMLAAAYPDAQVHHMAFERFAKAASKTLEPGGGWDLVIGNPPYPRRPAKDMRLDPEFAEWDRADVYFAMRCMSLLRPGGVLCFLTPMSNITGNSPENRRMREALLPQAHFLGAVFPVASIMPGVREGRFVIHLWARRATDEHELTEYEREVVLPGRYLETEAGKANTMGSWKQPERGRDVPFLVGPFEPDRVVNAVLDPIPRDEVEAMRLARGGSAPTVIIDTYPGHVDDEPEAPESVAGTPVLAAATSLSERIETYSRRAVAGGSSRALAEAGRPELVDDLTAFISTHGNPHAIRALRPLRKQMAPLLAAVSADGSLSAGLTQAQATGFADAPSAGASPQDVVSFYSRRLGVCTDLDLSRHFTEDVAPVLMADPSIAVEYQPDGIRWWYRNQEYSTGDLYARLDRVETALGGPEAAEELVRVKLQDQKALLLGALGEKNLTDIDVTPRSGFVPVECLSDWVNDVLFEAEHRHAVISWGDHYSRKKRVDPKLVRRRKAECYIEDGVLRIRHLGPELAEPESDWLVFLFGYWNRTLTVDDPEGRAAGRRNMFKPNTDLETRMKLEADLEGSFRMWLADSETWSAKIRDAYNRAYQGFRMRTYDTAAIPIARLGSPRGWKLKAHQNQSVRRLVDRRGGIVALDVGLGKTAVSLAFAALMRQEAKAHRCLVVVPSSIAGKWYADASAWLPDYRVGLIGISPGRHGPTSDDQATRAEKWNRLAQGEYELCICTQDNFLIDVALSTERTSEIVSRMFWLQRGLGTGKAETAMLERKIGDLEATIVRIEDEGRRLERELRELETANYHWQKGDRISLREKIEKIPGRIVKKQEELAATKAKLKLPTATAIEKVRGAAEGFVEERPFRPKDDRHVIEWEALGVDLLVLDEAHKYKNIWQADQRFGQSIKYMGGMAQGETGRRGRKGEAEGEGEGEVPDIAKSQSMTIRAWDMYLKCLDLLERNGDGGVVALTATPVKNSPIEFYNLISLVSQRVWESRQIRSKEEFIDRFCAFERQMVADMTTGSVGYELVMSSFTALGELRDILQTYLEHRTTKGVQQAQIEARVPLDEQLVVPEDVAEQINLPLGSVQQQVYHQLRDYIVEEQKRLREAKAKPSEVNALTLVLMSLLSKAALDPRLLTEDLNKIDREMAVATTYETRYKAWSEGGAKGRPPRAPDEDVLERLWRRQRILVESGVAQLVRDYSASGEIPAKYTALAKNIKSDTACGHIVFINYTDSYKHIVDVLVREGGVRRDQIITLTGDDDKADRGDIALQFNGRDAIVVKGQMVEDAVDPTKLVILGTDGAMSEGIDLQRRTCSIHHMDYDWTPATIHQRNGRGVRQGNMLGSVLVRYYLAERTIDVVKLATTWGKANWLESLFGKAESVANPAAAMQGDLEEAIATLFAPDPEEAKRQLAELRAARELQDIEAKRQRAQAQFISLVNQYGEIRNIRDPVAQATRMALADKTAEQLRMLPDRVLPRKELLSVIRVKPVLYDVASDYVLYPRSVVCFELSAGEATAEHKLEIVSFRAQASKAGRPLVAITARRFGQFETHTDERVTSLFGVTLASFEAKQRSTCEWDFKADVEGVIKEQHDHWAAREKVDLRNTTPLLVEHGGAALWSALYLDFLGGAAANYKIVPLRSATVPGQVILVKLDPSRRYSASMSGIELLSESTLLYPALPGSWRVFTEALRTGNTLVVHLEQGATAWSTPNLVQRQLDLTAPGGQDYADVMTMASKWWGRAVALAPLFREAENRRGGHVGIGF